MNSNRRIAILISGRGSNMQAIMDAIERKQLDAEIAVVISNRTDAAGLAIAQSRGYETKVIPSKGITRADQETQVINEIKSRNVALICLAGYMRLLSPQFIQAFPQQILNIHPSLLPAFPGMDAQQQALDYGVKFSGCTVHFVNEECDGGPIILQSVVPVLDQDTDETLSARILGEEHKTYAAAIQMVLDGHCQLNGRRVSYQERLNS